MYAMVVFGIGIFVGICWQLGRLIQWMLAPYRRKRAIMRSKQLDAFLREYPTEYLLKPSDAITDAENTMDDEIQTERAELQEQIDRQYIQLDLLKELSTILDNTEVKNTEKYIKARLSNEKQITVTLDKIQKLENKLARLE